jgi:hypothetical protein
MNFELALHHDRLPSVEDILPTEQANPTNILPSPDWLIKTIAEILAVEIPPPGDSPFIFDMTNEAAYHNSLVMRHYNNNITNIIDDNTHTILSYGSEFRPVQVLEKLLMHHPRWNKFSSIINNGSVWPLRAISDDLRKERNHELIKRGNHRSAEVYNDQLQSILQKEVKQGWMVPIPTSYIIHLDNVEIAPVGIAHQWQAHEDGSRTSKFRLTHDQSFEASVGESLNKRVEKEQLEELYYGHSLMRLLHYIISVRIHYPTTKILIAKTDFKGAY